MAKNREQKRKKKRKTIIKERQTRQLRETQRDKFSFLLHEAGWYARKNPEKAFDLIKRALQLFPDDPDAWDLLETIWMNLDEGSEAQFQSMAMLDERSALNVPGLHNYSLALIQKERWEEAMSAVERGLGKLHGIKGQDANRIKKGLEGIKRYIENREALGDAFGFGSWNRVLTRKDREGQAGGGGRKPKDQAKSESSAPSGEAKPPERKTPAADAARKAKKTPEVDVPVTVHIDTEGLEATFSEQAHSAADHYWLALEAYRVRLNETFDRLICISGLRNIQSLWYQEETARKVLKRFRGRALLADEVGLGKTIEALLVFSEYYQRGMIKNGLILTPTPLVSQWRSELASKFGLQFPTTDDPEFRSAGEAFWDAPFIVASINLAKSKKNFDVVTRREWDMVIVDEAHHLKNRTTLNWKLVNALKKKYLLLLSATPVENNLMELYNLITLLKPGQLKTASAFKEEFMTRGDPTDPRNREKLKSLLNEVMIRNTRAVARVGLPPRFAHTLRVEPTSQERELYERIEALIREMSRARAANRLLLKSLLAEAGSSPRAVQLALRRRLDNREVPKKEEQQIRAILSLCDGIKQTRKNRMLLDLLRSNPGKLIIFVKYLGTLDHLSEFLTENRFDHALFHGSLSNAQKDAQVARFSQDGADGADILLTTEIGGEGQNLQFCSKMINYDLPWNPMKIEQRIGRIHRIGQEKEVAIFNFCGAGSIEDYILEILDKKINMFEMVIGEIDMILGRIRGEQDFSDMAFDIWTSAATEEDRKAGFNRLATQLKRSKTSYLKTRELDDKLFEDSYEI